MTIKTHTRAGRRRLRLYKAAAKSLLRRATAKLSNIFRKARCSRCPTTQQRNTRVATNNDVAVDALFQGAFTVVDLAMAQSAHLQHQEIPSDTCTSTSWHTISSLTDDVPRADDAISTSASLARLPSKRLSELSATSLAQPGVFFGPPLQHRRKRAAGEVTITTTTTRGRQLPPFDVFQPSQGPENSVSSIDTVPEVNIAPEQVVSRNLSNDSGRHATHSSVDTNLNTRIFQSAGRDTMATTSSNRSMLISASSRHLSSGLSIDTFAGRKATRFGTGRTQDITLGGLEQLSAPFVQPESNEHSVSLAAGVEQSPNAEGTARNASEETSHVTIHTPALADSGYRLNTPPFREGFQLISRVPRPSTDSLSGNHDNLPPQFHPIFANQQASEQQVCEPPALQPTMPPGLAVNNVQLAIHELTQHLNDLFVDSNTHVWNAGALGCRVVAREQELVLTMQSLAQRDAENESLRGMLDQKDAELQELRTRLAQRECSGLSQNQREPGYETSDMYGGSSNDANNEAAYSENADGALVHVEESEDEDEILLSPEIDTRRYQIRDVETASDSAVLDLRETPMSQQRFQSRSC